MKCKDCVHYELYKIITSGYCYDYSADIPCKRCVHFGTNDEFEPKSKEKKGGKK